MKILLSTLNASIDSDIDPRFGRATNFLIIDPETLEWQGVENPAIHAPGGAGIQAAQFVANQGCEAAVSGEFGPNAFNTLNAAGIKMYVYGSCKTAQEAIEKFKSGELEALTAAVGSGHKFRPA